MCNFLSAVVLRNGDVLTHPMLDSHSELIQRFKLPDTHAYHQHFAKVELTPVGDWLDVSAWKFRLDEETAPGWWADVAESVEAELRRRADKMILRDGEHRLIVDGCWIVGGDAKVRDVRSGRIVRVSGGSITDVRGGSITDVSGGSITDVSGGSITDVSGGSITGVWGGSITGVSGGSITGVRGGSITGVWGGSITEPIPNPYYTLTLDESAKKRIIKAVNS
jgi:hypothetical protein